MDDEFIRDYIEDLLRTIRTQVLRRVIRPYTRISLEAIARELNDIPVASVENLLVGLILDGTLDGQIDQVDGVLLKKAERGGGESNSTQNSKRVTKAQAEHDLITAKYDAMNQLSKALDGISTSVNSARMKEAASLRGMAH